MENATKEMLKQRKMLTVCVFIDEHKAKYMPFQRVSENFPQQNDLRISFSLDGLANAS